MKKTVLITGASRGIGRECAALFCKNGYNVAANYLNSGKEINELVREYPDIFPVRADVSDAEQVKSMFDKISNRFGDVDVLINNAGIALEKLFTETEKDEWDRLFGVNVDGVFNCSREAAKIMIHNHKGKIINISSMWGVCGASCEVAYSATKAAVIGFTKALAKELGPSGINVNCITPGIIDTDMNRNINSDIMQELISETPLQAIGKSRDIAETALFLASDSANFITGQIIGVNGGFLI